MLELQKKQNFWTPPMIDALKMARDISNDINARQSNQFFYIFQTVPYIDSIYIKYNSKREPEEVRRYAFHDGYTWKNEYEEVFDEQCVKNDGCSYNGGAIEAIYARINIEHPEWHIQRYYSHGLRMLDHIYNCIKQNTAKEILYKAGLDELAVHIDEIDELNLLAGSPSEIYDGLSMRILKSLNCPCGSELLSQKKMRLFVKRLNSKFPKIFNQKMNDAMCRYLSTLINGDLTVGEAGRLFQSRRKDLSMVWTMSYFDIFMARDAQWKELETFCNVIKKIDPIYADYIKDCDISEDESSLKQLALYLVNRRDEYDRAIRVVNRKKEYDWMERGKKYYVRYPQTINDFCREAIYMGNCLITYVEALIQNDTTILFMRKADEVNKPFITMEIFDGQLMQAYHRFNEDCTPEEADWIRGYCVRHGIGLGKFNFNAEIDELF